jgi:GxxExxY protein
MLVEKISNIAIGSAIEVHRQLGPGLLESAYQRCLCYELSENGIYFESEKPMPIIYKAIELNHGYRMNYYWKTN